jgi:hypothetical protein
VDDIRLFSPGFTVSGVVGGEAAEGVVLTLSGDASETTASDGAGYFEFLNLPDGTYTIVPSLSGFTFTPSSETVTVSGADPAPVDFLARRTTGPSTVYEDAEDGTTAGWDIFDANPTGATISNVYDSGKASRFIRLVSCPSLGDFRISSHSMTV